MMQPPEQQGKALMELATKPNQPPQIAQTGAGTFAIYQDGSQVYLGPPTSLQEVHFYDPASKTNKVGFRDAASGQLTGVVPDKLDPGLAPLTPERQQQELNKQPPVRFVDPADNQTKWGRLDVATGKYVPAADAPPEASLQPLTPEAEAQKNRMALQQGVTAKKIEQASAGQAALDAGRTKAMQTLSTLDQWDGLINQSFKTGKLTPVFNTIGAYAQQAGIDLGGLGIGLSGKEAATGEALTKVSNAMVRSLIGTDVPGGGIPPSHFSNLDMNILTQSVPNLTNQPLANAIVSAFMRQAAQREIDHAQALTQAQRDDPDKFFQFERDYTAEMQKPANRIIKPVQSPDDIARLAPGSIYQRPDGQIGLVPRQ